MSGSKLYIPKNGNSSVELEVIKTGRVLHDLFETGPWRIDLEKLKQSDKELDWTDEKNIFNDFIIEPTGSEFSYHKCGDNIVITWNKIQNFYLDNVPVPLAQFTSRVRKIFDALKAKFPLLNHFPLSSLSLSLAHSDVVETCKNVVPDVAHVDDYGLCLNDDNEPVRVYETDSIMRMPPNTRLLTVNFIIYELNRQFTQLPFVREYLTEKNDAGQDAKEAAGDFRHMLLGGDNVRCRLKAYPQTMLEDQSQGHWDLYWPDGVTPDERWYKLVELENHYHARNPAKDIQKVSVAIDFGTTGTVVAVRNRRGEVTLLRIGAQENELRQGIMPSHFVNPTVLSIENAHNLLAAWRAVPYRPAVNWNDIQCSHQALEELPARIRSGLTSIKAWARGHCGDDPLVLIDSKNAEIELPITEPKGAENLNDDFAEVPLNPVELYAFFLGLFLNNQIVDGGQIYTSYYMTFPAKFERETRDRILCAFRRGLLRSLPASLAYSPDWKPEKLRVIERANEPAALAAAILPLLKEDGTEFSHKRKAPVQPNADDSIQKEIAEIESGLAALIQELERAESEAPDEASLEQTRKELGEKRDALLKRLETLQAQTSARPQNPEPAPLETEEGKTPAKPILPTEAGVPFGVFDFGGGTTDFAIGLYRLPTTEERDEQAWESVIDILDSSGDPVLGGEELVTRLVFEVVRANMPKFLENEVIPFERGKNDPHVPGSEEIFAKSAIARENSRKLGEKLRPIWEKGVLETPDESGQIAETFTDISGKRRENVILNVDVDALKKMLTERISAGVEKFFLTFAQAFNRYELKADSFHIILAGNSSQSPLVMECFRKKIDQILGDNQTDDRIVLHLPIMPDPANPEGVTLKTGVAIGLLNVLDGEPTGMVTRQHTQDETFFPFTVGPLQQGFVQPILKRNAVYGEWKKFGKVHKHGLCKFYFTDSPLALSGRASRSDCLEGQIDWGTDNFGKTIVVRAEKPGSVLFGLQNDDGSMIDESVREYKLE